MNSEEAFSYPLVLYEDREDGEEIWRGNFPGLNGCWLEAATRDEVIARAPSVLGEYAAACRGAGWRLPRAPELSELRDTGVGEVFMIWAE